MICQALSMLRSPFSSVGAKASRDVTASIAVEAETAPGAGLPSSPASGGLSHLRKAREEAIARVRKADVGYKREAQARAEAMTLMVLRAEVESA